MSRHTLLNRTWYRLNKIAYRLLGILLYRFRCHDRNRIPKSGALLILSNHQSHLDPPLIGMIFDQQLRYLARDTLFKFAPFRWYIQSVGAIPIDREGIGLAGLKETLKHIRQEGGVLIFPEGTRTQDGEVASLKPGFTVIAKRTQVPILPVALDGAFDAWPPSRRLPRLTTIHVQVGEPIPPETISSLSDEELLELLEEKIRDCHKRAREKRLLAMKSRSASTIHS